MFKSIQKLYKLLDTSGRRRSYLMLFLILKLALLEMLGVASVMPFVMVISNPEVVQTNAYLYSAYQYFDFKTTSQFMFALGLTMLMVLLLTLSYQALMTYLLERFIHNQSYILSRFLVESYLRQPYDFFLNRHSADLGKSILSEAQQVISGALRPLMYFVSGGAVTIAIALLLFNIDPRFALIMSFGLAFGYGSIYFFARKALHRLGVQKIATNRKRFETVQECFGGIKEVKITGLEAPYLKRFDVAAKAFAESHALAIAYKSLPIYVLQGLTYGSAFIIILYLMRQPGGLQVAIPTLTVFALGAQRLLPALGLLYKNIALLRFADAAVDNLYQDVQGLSGKKILSKKDLNTIGLYPLNFFWSIELNNLCYRYPAAKNYSLNSINLSISARSKVGFVGSSGSGKTTTIDIILGLLSPTSGNLLVDGVPISGNNVRAWQKNIGYVPQNIYLIDDTIAANIAFGVPEQDVNQQAVERAAKVANLHDFIVGEMPLGYETTVGERGVRLSGGQRQRIGIARALYHNPAVLVLDEATSALDNLTEQLVMESVDNIGTDKTIIIVAHRLSTVRKCDTIYFLEKGIVKAHGSYDHLLMTCPQFNQMSKDAGI